MVSTTAYHPGIEEDPEQLDTDSPGLISVNQEKRGRRKLASHSKTKHSISFHFSKRYPHLISLQTIKRIALGAFSTNDRHRWFLRQDNAGDEKGTR